MPVKPLFSPQELILIQQSIEQITIKGIDAPTVTGVLSKISKEIQKSLPEQ